MLELEVMRGWSLTEADGERRLSLEGGRSLPLAGEANAQFEQDLIQLIERSDKVRYSTFSASTTSPGRIERSILDAPASKDAKIFYGTNKMSAGGRDLASPSAEARLNPRAHVYQSGQGLVKQGDRSYPIEGGSYFHDKLALFEVAGQKLALVLTANATQAGFGHSGGEHAPQMNVYKLLTKPDEVAEVERILNWKFNEGPDAGKKPTGLKHFLLGGPGVDLRPQYEAIIRQMFTEGDVTVASPNVDPTLQGVFDQGLADNPERLLTFLLNETGVEGTSDFDRPAMQATKKMLAQLQAKYGNRVRTRSYNTRFLSKATVQRMLHFNSITGAKRELVGGQRFKEGFLKPGRESVTDVAYISDDSNAQLSDLIEKTTQAGYLTEPTRFLDALFGRGSDAPRAYQTNKPYLTGYVASSGRVPNPQYLELIAPSARSDTDYQLILTFNTFNETSAFGYNLSRHYKAKGRADYDALWRDAARSVWMGDRTGVDSLQNLVRDVSALYPQPGIPGTGYLVTPAMERFDRLLGKRTFGASIWPTMATTLGPTQMGEMGVLSNAAVLLGRWLDRYLRYNESTALSDYAYKPGPLENMAYGLSRLVYNSIGVAFVFGAVALPALELAQQFRTTFLGSLESMRRGAGPVRHAVGSIGLTLADAGSRALNSFFASSTREVLGRVADVFDNFFPSAGMARTVEDMTQTFARNAGGSAAANIVQVTRQWNDWVVNRPLLKLVTHTEEGVMGIWRPFMQDNRYKGLLRTVFAPVALPHDWVRQGGLRAGTRHYFSSLSSTWVGGGRDLFYGMRQGNVVLRAGMALMLGAFLLDHITGKLGTANPVDLPTQIQGSLDTQLEILRITQGADGRAQQGRVLWDKSPGQMWLFRDASYPTFAALGALAGYISAAPTASRAAALRRGGLGAALGLAAAYGFSQLGENRATGLLDALTTAPTLHSQEVLAKAWNIAEQNPAAGIGVGAGLGFATSALVFPNRGKSALGLALRAGGAALGAAAGASFWLFARLFPQKERLVYAGSSSEANKAVAHQATMLIELAKIKEENAQDPMLRQERMRAYLQAQGGVTAVDDLNALMAELSQQSAGNLRRMGHELGQLGMYQLPAMAQRELKGSHGFSSSVQMPGPVPFISTMTFSRLELRGNLHYGVTLQGPVNVQVGSSQALPWYYQKTRQPPNPALEGFSTGAATGLGTLLALSLLGFNSRAASLVGGLAGLSTGLYAAWGARAEGEKANPTGYELAYEPGNVLETLLLPYLTLRGFEAATQLGVRAANLVSGGALGAATPLRTGVIGQAFNFGYGALRLAAALPLYVAQSVLFSLPRRILSDLVFSPGIAAAGQGPQARQAFDLARQSPLASERAQALERFFTTGQDAAGNQVLRASSRGQDVLRSAILRAYSIQEWSRGARLAAQELVHASHGTVTGAAEHFYRRTLYGLTQTPPAPMAARGGARALALFTGAAGLAYTFGPSLLASTNNFFRAPYSPDNATATLTDEVVSFFRPREDDFFMKVIRNTWSYGAVQHMARQVLGIGLPSSQESTPMRFVGELDAVYEARTSTWNKAHSGEGASIFQNQMMYALSMFSKLFYLDTVVAFFSGTSTAGATPHSIEGKIYNNLTLNQQHQEGYTSFFYQLSPFNWFQTGVLQVSAAEGEQGVRNTRKDEVAMRKAALLTRQRNPLKTLKAFPRGPAVNFKVGTLYNDQMGIEDLSPAAQGELARRRSMVAFFTADGNNSRMLGYFNAQNYYGDATLFDHMPIGATLRYDQGFYLFKQRFGKQFTEDMRLHSRQSAFGQSGTLDEFEYEITGDGSGLNQPTGMTREEMLGGKPKSPSLVYYGGLAAGTAAALTTGLVLYHLRNARVQAVGGSALGFGQWLGLAVNNQGQNLFFRPYFLDPSQRGTALAPTPTAAGMRYRNFWAANVASQRFWTYQIGSSFYTFASVDAHIINPALANTTRTYIDPVTGAPTTTRLTNMAPAAAYEQEFFRTLTTMSYDSDLTRFNRMLFRTVAAGSSATLLGALDNRITGMTEMRTALTQMRADSEAKLRQLRSASTPLNSLEAAFERAHSLRLTTFDALESALDVAHPGGLSTMQRVQNLSTVRDALREFITRGAGASMTEQQLRTHLSSTTVGNLLSSTTGGALHPLPGAGLAGRMVTEFVEDSLQSLQRDVVTLRSSGSMSLPERLGYTGLAHSGSMRFLVALSGGHGHILTEGWRQTVVAALRGGILDAGGSAFYTEYVRRSRAGQVTHQLVNAIIGATPSGSAVTAFGAAENAAMLHILQSDLDTTDQTTLRTLVDRVRTAATTGGAVIAASHDEAASLRALQTAIEDINATRYGIPTTAGVAASTGEHIRNEIRGLLRVNGWGLAARTADATLRLPGLMLPGFFAFHAANQAVESQLSVRALAAVDPRRDEFSNQLAAETALKYRNQGLRAAEFNSATASVAQASQYLMLHQLQQRGLQPMPAQRMTGTAAAWRSAGLWQAGAMLTGGLLGGGMGLVAGGGDTQVAGYYAQQGASVALGYASAIQAVVLGTEIGSLALAAFSGGAIATAALGAAALLGSFGVGYVANQMGLGLSVSFAMSGAMIGAFGGGLLGAAVGGVIGFGVGTVANYLMRSNGTDDPQLAAKLAASQQTRTGRMFSFVAGFGAEVLNTFNTWAADKLKPAAPDGTQVQSDRMWATGLGAVFGLALGGVSLPAVAIGASVGLAAEVMFPGLLRTAGRTFFDAIGYRDATRSPEVQALYDPSQNSGLLSPSANPQIWRLPAADAPPGSGYYFARMSPVFQGLMQDAIYQQYQQQKAYASSPNAAALLHHLLPTEQLNNRPSYPTDTHMSAPVDPYGESYDTFKSLSTAGSGAQAMLMQRAESLQRAYAQLEASKPVNWGRLDASGNPQLSAASIHVQDEAVLARARAAGLPTPSDDAGPDGFANPISGAVPGIRRPGLMIKLGSIYRLGEQRGGQAVQMTPDEVARYGTATGFGIFRGAAILTSSFGHRHQPTPGASTYHPGIDLVPAPGVAPTLHAVAAGTVREAGWNGGYGYMVSVESQVNGSRYMLSIAHMQARLAVKTGDTVQAGALLGLMGSTGVSTGPHAHVEVRRYDERSRSWVLENPYRSALFSNSAQRAPIQLSVGNRVGGVLSEANQKLAQTANTYDQHLQKAGSQFGVDWQLLKAVMLVESGGNPAARGSSGEVGLMQLMEATARGLGVQDRADPWQNIQGGARYLAEQLNQRGGNVPLALASYNAGPNAVTRAGNVIPQNGTTPAYVDRVLAYYHYLKNQAKERQAAPDKLKEEARKQLHSSTPALTSQVARHRRLQAGAPKTAQAFQPKQVKGRVVVSASRQGLVPSLVDHNQPRPAKPSVVTAKAQDGLLELSYHAVEGWMPDCLVDTSKAPSRSQAPDPFIHDFQGRGHCA